MPRMLGIDVGHRRIGVAVCDELGLSVNPIGFIPRDNDRQAAGILAALAKQEKAEGLVFGLPLHTHGGSGEAVTAVRRFIAAVKVLCALPVHEVDERYTSTEAAEILRAEGVKVPVKGQLDAKAAAVILRRWLDGEDRQMRKTQQGEEDCPSEKTEPQRG